MAEKEPAAPGSRVPVYRAWNWDALGEKNLPWGTKREAAGFACQREPLTEGRSSLSVTRVFARSLPSG